MANTDSLLSRIIRSLCGSRPKTSAPYVVRTWVTRVGSSSYTLASDIRDDDTLLSRAEAVLVAFDPATQRSRPLSEAERRVLESALSPDTGATGQTS